jgi:hypothetical protein
MTCKIDNKIALESYDVAIKKPTNALHTAITSQKREYENDIIKKKAQK